MLLTFKNKFIPPIRKSKKTQTLRLWKRCPFAPGAVACISHRRDAESAEKPHESKPTEQIKVKLQMTPCHYSRILLFSSLYPFASPFSLRSLRLCGEKSAVVLSPKLGKVKINSVEKTLLSELSQDDAVQEGFERIEQLPKSVREIYSLKRIANVERFKIRFTYLGKKEVGKEARFTLPRRRERTGVSPAVRFANPEGQDSMREGYVE
jgi:hypothetical protein